MNSAPRNAVIVLIPAYMAAQRIADTVAAARRIPGVTRVLVIDDGSTDATAARAAQAGAEVLRLARNGGKGAALRAGLAACPGAATDIFLLLDADLAATAAEAEKLLLPILRDEADLTIAQFPALPGKAGFGFVKGLARWGAWLLTRRWISSPISGQRACRRALLETAPFADGYGVEVAMNVAAGDAGARIREVPVAMTHQATGRDWHGFTHRGRQFLHIFHALLAAALGRTGEPLFTTVNPWRAACWLLGFVLILAVLTPSHWPWPLLLALGLLAAAVSVPGSAILAGVFRARKRNYRRRYLPALGGLLLLPVCGLLLVVFLRSGPPLFPGDTRLPAVAYPLVLLFLMCWMCLGMYDDVYGDAQRKGFRGHLRALRQGHLTAGGVKCVLGGCFALAAAVGAAVALRQPWYAVPVMTLLIALSANALNLCDLRPGRALKVFWATLTPVALLGSGDASLLLIALVVLLATLAYAPLDFAGLMMLGDTGANPLGAMLGLYLALFLPLPAQTAIVLALIALHYYAERASITQTIERVGWLRRLDQLGRPR